MGLLRGIMLKTVVTTLGLFLAACSVGSVNGAGDDTPGDGGGNDPRAATFATMVKPLVDAKTCTDATCHGGITNPNLTSFEALTSNSVLAAKYLKQPSAENVIITKDAGTGTHSARPYLDATDKQMISAWIDSGP
jgi:hypothetical protein